jgi:hypothetical protein
VHSFMCPRQPSASPLKAPPALTLVFRAAPWLRDPRASFRVSNGGVSRKKCAFMAEDGDSWSQSGVPFQSPCTSQPPSLLFLFLRRVGIFWRSQGGKWWLSRGEICAEAHVPIFSAAFWPPIPCSLHLMPCLYF